MSNPGEPGVVVPPELADGAAPGAPNAGRARRSQHYIG
jgi:hypothetical protein